MYFIDLGTVVFNQLVVLGVHVLVGSQKRRDLTFPVLAGPFDGGDIPEDLIDIDRGFVYLHLKVISLLPQLKDRLPIDLYLDPKSLPTILALILNTFLLFLEHVVSGLDIGDLVLKRNELVLLVLQIV